MTQSAIVVFDFTAWAIRYPELAYIGSTLAQAYFQEAQLYCNNTACSPVPNCAPVYQRQQFLWMITAHIAALNAATASGQPASPLVGRISSAGEGSVNVSAENLYGPGTVQWYQQTKYGSAYWAASQSYRTMRYVVGPQFIPPFGGPFGVGLTPRGFRGRRFS